MKKSAFTVAELVVVLVIIGVIIVMGLLSLQGRMNQYGAPYYTAYNALRKASYNILADLYCPDPSSDDAECREGPRPIPDNSSYKLCMRLREFINSPKIKDGEAMCGSGPNDTSRDINDLADNIYVKGKDDAVVRLIATNGMRFYISSPKTYALTGGTIKYYIVYVDLNGEKMPNRVGKNAKDKVYPDVVPFALTTRGELIPMGYPIYSNMYLTAKVKYPVQYDASTNVMVDDLYSKSMSFYDAINFSWGGQEHIDIPYSIKFNSKIPDNSQAKSFFVSSTPPAKALDEVHGCISGSYTCRVTVDSYTDKRY